MRTAPISQPRDTRAEAARQTVGLAQSAEAGRTSASALTASGERTEDAPEGFSNDYFLGLKLSLPLPLWNRNEGRIAEASAAAARRSRKPTRSPSISAAKPKPRAARWPRSRKLVAEIDDGLLPKAAQIEEQLRRLTAPARRRSPKCSAPAPAASNSSQRRVDALRDYHLARVRYDAASGEPTPTARQSEK